jgi:hypothetical protein
VVHPNSQSTSLHETPRTPWSIFISMGSVLQILFTFLSCYYSAATIWWSLESVLSAVRLETALADSHAFTRRIASCVSGLRELTIHSASRHSGMLVYSDHCKRGTVRFDFSSNQEMTTVLHSSARSGACYVTLMRGQGPLNSGATTPKVPECTADACAVTFRHNF